MKKLLPTLLIDVVLTGRSARTVLGQKKTAYDPTTDAQIRIYQNNGNRTIKAVSATSCQDIKEGKKQVHRRNPFKKENVYNGLPRRALKSISIGMPLTQHAVNTLECDSDFETDSFIEQQIPANISTLVSGASWFAISNSAGSIRTESRYACGLNAEFTPKAGVD